MFRLLGKQLEKDNQEMRERIQQTNKENDDLKETNQMLRQSDQQTKIINQRLKQQNVELKKENDELKKDVKWLRNWVITMKENDENYEINRLFNNSIKKQTISNEDIEAFIEEFDEFDKMFDEYFNEREQRLRKPTQKMNSKFGEKMIRWKKNKEIRRTTQLDEVQQKYGAFIDETEKMIKQKNRKQNLMLGEYGTNIKMVRELKRCKNEVRIGDANDLDGNRKQIEECEQKGQEQIICIDFHSDDSSVNSKMKVMNMIDELNFNHKVGLISIGLSNDNKWSQQVIQLMMDRYHNMHGIHVYDGNEQVDEEVHDEIQQLVRQSALLEFVLSFERGGLTDNNGIKLMKRYNRLIQHQYYLEKLKYEDSRIGCKGAGSQQEVDELVDEVNRMQ